MTVHQLKTRVNRKLHEIGLPFTCEFLLGYPTDGYYSVWFRPNIDYNAHGHRTYFFARSLVEQFLLVHNDLVRIGITFDFGEFGCFYDRTEWSSEEERADAPAVLNDYIGEISIRPNIDNANDLYVLVREVLSQYEGQSSTPRLQEQIIAHLNAVLVEQTNNLVISTETSPERIQQGFIDVTITPRVRATDIDAGSVYTVNERRSLNRLRQFGETDEELARRISGLPARV